MCAIYRMHPEYMSRPHVSAGFPPVDIVNETDTLVIMALIPGLKRKEITVSVNDRVVEIEGQRKRRSPGGHCLLRERRYGQFRKSISLPAAVDPDRSVAAYRYGILTIDLPKKKAPVSRTIAIE